MDLEIAKTESRFIKQQERLEKDFGWASTIGPTAITTNFINKLTDEVPNFLIANNRNEKDFIELVKDLPHEIVALSCLTSALNIIGSNRRSFSGSLQRFGRDLEGECYAQGLIAFDAKLAERLDRLARSRHGDLKYRKQAVRSIAKKNKFVVAAWSNKQYTIAGNWAMNFITSVLPEVFSIVIVDGHNEKELALTEDAFNLAEAAIRQAIYAHPVFLPKASKPEQWADWSKKEARFKNRHSLLRSRHTDTAAHVRGAINTGTMQPALDAVNAVQGIGYKINTAILDVITWCKDNCVNVPGLPRAKDLPLPERAKPWDAMSPEEQKAWKIRANQVKLRNRGFSAERVLLAEDLITAEYLDKQGEFYTPCNYDWRGRLYPLPHFNYQRDDRVRSLFLFHKGVPITEEGVYWLKVHVANTGDFGKISKKSFAERVQWVEDNIHTIKLVAKVPTKETMWHNADKPFMFLAACMELVSAINNPQHITHLPVSLDGTCSGLQHLSAMTQAAEGALVNLTHSEVPQDVYSIVADRVRVNLERIRSDNTTTGTERDLATICLNNGITRSLVKRNVMTYGYSSQKFGMGSQLMEDLMQPLALEVLSGQRPHHPYGEDNGWIASRFLAREIFSAIEEVVKKPAEAMSFLRQMAKALAHENKPVIWFTPAGIPWINRYHQPTIQRVTLWLHDRGVNLSHSVGVASGFTKQIDKVKAANGIAPNFVHALDASHLVMTVNALNEKGVTDIALVHDSFGVHCSNVAVLATTLREQFVRLYTEFDPLNDILECNKARMDSPSRLPKPVAKGPLDIREIMNAEYAFS